MRRVLKLDVRRIGKARAGIRQAALGGAAAPREGGAEALCRALVDGFRDAEVPDGGERERERKSEGRRHTHTHTRGCAGRSPPSSFLPLSKPKACLDSFLQLQLLAQHSAPRSALLNYYCLSSHGVEYHRETKDRSIVGRAKPCLLACPTPPGKTGE